MSPWVCVWALAACGPPGDAEDVGALAESSGSTSVEPPPATETGEGDVSSSGQPEDQELPACYDEGRGLFVHLTTADPSDFETAFHINEEYRCTQADLQVEQASNGDFLTEIALACTKEVPDERVAIEADFILSVWNVVVDLGPEPMELKFLHEGVANPELPNAPHFIWVSRDGELLVYGFYDGLAPEGLSSVGATEFLGEEPCTFDGECGRPYGIEGTGPNGEQVRDASGDPIEVVHGDRTMLVGVRGISPVSCPDYEGPKHRVSFAAIDTRLVVLR